MLDKNAQTEAFTLSCISAVYKHPVLMKFCVISLLATIVLERISYFPVSEITLGLWTIILGTGPWFDPSHVSVDCHCGKAWNLKKNLGTVIWHTLSFLYWACGQYIVAALHNTTDILLILTFPAQYNLVVSTFRTSPVFPVSPCDWKEMQ